MEKSFCIRFLLTLCLLDTRNRLLWQQRKHDSIHVTILMSHGMRFPTMWYVRPAKPQISLRIRAA